MVARTGKPIQGDTRIAKIMRKKQMRVYHVCSEMDMSERVFRERLHGRKKLSADEATRLAEILEVPVEWLDEDTEEI